MKCPLCGDKAELGFTAVYCTSPTCEYGGGEPLIEGSLAWARDLHARGIRVGSRWQGLAPTCEQDPSMNLWIPTLEGVSWHRM